MPGARIILRQITALMAGTRRHAATRQRLSPTPHRTALAVVAITVAAVAAVLRTAAVVVVDTPVAAEAAILVAVAIINRS
jgi:hypothetical protein